MFRKCSVASFPLRRLSINCRISRLLWGDRGETQSSGSYSGIPGISLGRKKRCYSTLSSSLSYDHGLSDVPLMGCTIGSLMEERAEKHPDREAFVFPHQGIRKTFAELLEDSDKVAAGLMALGVRRGDRVGIWSPNYYEWIMAQYGTARAGIILVGVKAIICPVTFKTQSYYDMLLNLCPELEDCQPGQLKSRVLPELTSVIMMGDSKQPGTLTMADLLAAGGPKERTEVQNLQKQLQFDEPINIQFTSGTTGTPKGATLTHHNIINNCQYVGLRIDYHKNPTRICVPVPLYHCFGMVMASLQTMVHGAKCIFPAPTFEPLATVNAVQEEKCTSLYGTPTMFIDMLHLPDIGNYDLSSLYTGIMAGSSCPIEVMKNVISTMNMDKFTICYGTTENSPVTYQSFMDDPLEKRVSSVGKPSAHTELKVINSDGEIVPRGEKGELCVRGYSVMQGYWNDPKMTSGVIDETGWYHTGDLAVMDEEGYGYIVGRIKDMIIRGGENIYPLEIEQLLYEHPDISDVQVVGVPDERMGEEICAFIKLRSGHHTTPENVRDFCRGKLSHFKIPKYIHFVHSYPLTVSGKVKKHLLRDEAVVLFKPE